MEKLSLGSQELYKMLGITPPIVTENMDEVKLEKLEEYTDKQLIHFLETGELLVDDSSAP